MTETTILNVDDNDAIRYARTRIMQRAGFDVMEASTGQEALQRAADMPSLILLDVHLPDVSGLEVCRRLKSSPLTRDIPVLQVSATACAGMDRAKGLENGADSYLTEPVEPEVLIATTRALLRAREAEESIRRAAKEWQSTFDAINDGLAVLNAQGQILRCNRALGQVLGKAAEELIGQPCYKIVASALGPPPSFPFLRMLDTAKRERIEYQVGNRWIAISADPLLDSAGRITGGVWKVSDITENKQLEEQLRHSQKAESIAVLAAGVAHDFNNLLTGIIGNTSIALSELEPNHPNRSNLEDVMVAGEKAADVTRQLLAYAGRGKFVVRQIHLSQLIVSTGKLLEASIPKKTQLRFELESDLPLTEGDPDQMRQLLLNLVINAAEAIGDETGTLTIRTRASRLDETRDDLPAGPYVVLEVKDTGVGMDEATKSRIFEPFFSTKFLGRGMGLAAALGIVLAHRGRIQVQSSPGSGSTFTTYLPAVAAAPKLQLDEGLNGTGTILVVDDEEVVRQTAKMALQRYGYHVLLAEDGVKAIDIVRQHASEIRLVILDMTMPVMSGEEAFQHISEIAPNLPVIASTGYSQAEAANRFTGDQVVGFLQKPYTAPLLGRTVKAALTSSGLAGRATQ